MLTVAPIADGVSSAGRRKARPESRPGAGSLETAAPTRAVQESMGGGWPATRWHSTIHPSHRNSEATTMSARTKLNLAYTQGCLLLAAVLGLVAGSWTVFVAALAVSIVGSLHAGEIRLSRR